MAEYCVNSLYVRARECMTYGRMCVGDVNGNNDAHACVIICCCIESCADGVVGIKTPYIYIFYISCFVGVGVLCAVGIKFHISLYTFRL
jgi:hypothetical protein